MAATYPKVPVGKSDPAFSEPPAGLLAGWFVGGVDPDGCWVEFCPPQAAMDRSMVSDSAKTKSFFIIFIFINSDAYFQCLGQWINDFSDRLPYPKESLLGVCIAIQGLVSSDGETITYAEILHCTGTKREAFQKYIALPCWLVHDTEAMALAEIWANPEMENFVYLVLNRNFGGILILNSQILGGKELSSGIIEHMCLSPDGPTCYCGKRGCLETFCSADSLKNVAQMELPEFFQCVHMGEHRCTKLWHNYLRYLAVAVDNIRMVVDCDFILGGYLTQFINEEDVNLLTQYVKEQCAFKTPDFTFQVSQSRGKAAKIGAALTLIEKFIESM